MANGISTKPRFSELEKEIQLLRSFVIGIAGKDKEGNYKPEFVRKILQAVGEKERFTFKNKRGFLARIQNK